jgi:hypothetical protein
MLGSSLKGSRLGGSGLSLCLTLESRGGLLCQKGNKRGSVTPTPGSKLVGFGPALGANVKKGPNGRFQGSVPGEQRSED